MEVKLAVSVPLEDVKASAPTQQTDGGLAALDFVQLKVAHGGTRLDVALEHNLLHLQRHDSEKLDANAESSPVLSPLSPSAGDRSNEVTALLSELKLDCYNQAFLSSGLDSILMLLHCRAEDLLAMNVKAGHARAILRAAGEALVAQLCHARLTEQRGESEDKKLHRLAADREFNLGVQFVLGDGSTRYPVAALRHFEQAAQLGHAEALVKLGVFYFQGFNAVKIDAVRAYALFKAAHDRQARGAAYYLGYMHLHGLGVKQDVALAKQLWKTDPDDVFCRLSLLVDAQQAAVPAEQESAELGECMQALQQLAEAGDTEAQLRLSRALEFGKGVTKDVNKSLLYLQKAALVGHAQAQNCLGYAFEHGLAVERDHKQAFGWYLLAAEQRFAMGMFNVALCYRDGRGTHADQQRALFWLQLAADAGLALAQERLARAFQFGRLGLPRNQLLAVHWFEKAATLGSESAKQKLQALDSEASGLATPRSDAVDAQPADELALYEQLRSHSWSTSDLAGLQTPPSPAESDSGAAAEPASGHDSPSAETLV